MCHGDRNRVYRFVELNVHLIKFDLQGCAVANRCLVFFK
jgi:hypothetical protein